MKKSLALIVLYFMAILWPVLSCAQKEPVSEFYSQISLPKSQAFFPNQIISETNLQQFIAKQYPVSSYGKLEIVEQIKSTAATHYLLQQYYQNIPVFQGTVKVNISSSGKILSVFENLYAINQFSFELNNLKDKIGEVYLKQQYGSLISEIRFTEKPVWYAEQNSLKPGTLLQFSHPDFNIGSKEVLLNAQGQIVHSQDLNLYFRPQTPKDTLVKAMVFLPDPLTTAQVNYQTPFVDSADADLPVLNQQRFQVDLPLTYRNDTFYLENDYCIIRDFDTPVKAVCHDTTHIKDFTRGNDCFEQVNILYHISTIQQHIQALGFLNLQNQPIEIDAHGMSGMDMSRYSPLDNTISYGEGGVDDGEDADVIIHEYFHAISNSAAPNTGTGQERRTLEEGNADYFAASYSMSNNSYNWAQLFNWDGHNEYWAGRSVVSSKIYPYSIQNNVYSDAEIWSSTLMQINQSIGRNETDKLLLQSLYSYAPYLSLSQAAELFLQADTLLNQAANTSVIFNHFYNRGILKHTVVGNSDKNESGIAVLNTAGFLHGGSISILFPEITDASILITDMTGRKVWHQRIHNQQDYQIPQLSLSPGVYLMHIQTPQHLLVKKLVRQ